MIVRDLILFANIRANYNKDRYLRSRAGAILSLALMRVKLIKGDDKDHRNMRLRFRGTLRIQRIVCSDSGERCRLAPPILSKEPRRKDMTVSRRKFVKATAMMGISAVTVLKGAGRVLGQQKSYEREELFRVPDESQPDFRLTEETFSQYINTKFRIYTAHLGAVDLELISVRRRAQSSSVKSSTAPTNCFSVVFRGPRRWALESKTYRVEHDQMGVFDLFIAPVNDHKKQRHYEAVFNLLEQ
jgi:hypothetical protein